MEVLALALALAAGACGGDDEAGGGAPAADPVRTTDAGTRIVAATDPRRGLEVEVQDDSLYVHLAPDAPPESRALAGEPLGGSCTVDGGGGVRVERQFPVLWREEYGDWGTALARIDPPVDIENTEPVLAQHVLGCRLFDPQPTAVPGELSFDEATDPPFATVTLRRPAP